MGDGQDFTLSVKEYLYDPLRKNAIFLILNTIGISVLGLAFWFLAAKYVSASVIGSASVVISIIALLVSLSSLGLGMGFIRFLPDKEAVSRSKLINSVFILTGIFGLVITAVYIIGVPLWTPKISSILSFPLLMLFLLLFVLMRLLSMLLNSVFISYRATKYVLFKETVLFNLLKLVLLPFLIFLGAVGIILSWGIGVAISLTVSITILIVRFRYRPAFSLNLEPIKRILSFSLGNYVAGFLASLPTFLLPIVFLHRLSSAEAGYFYITWTIGAILFTVVGNVCMALFAEGSHEYRKFSENIRKTVRFLVLIVVPAILAIWFFGDKMLAIVGEDFSREGATLLRYLAISSIPLIVVSIYITIKRVEKRVKEMILIHGIIAGFTLGAAFVLSPEYGILSAGIGWVSGHVAALGFIGAEVFSGKIRTKGLST